jgi:Golgi nucleoside diphosphatase
VLAAGPFQFKREWASVLSGTFEGLYGWVAANYGAGKLTAMARTAGLQRSGTASQEMGLAVAEMGGASAQVTFVLGSE